MSRQTQGCAKVEHKGWTLEAGESLVVRLPDGSFLQRRGGHPRDMGVMAKVASTPYALALLEKLVALVVDERVSSVEHLWGVVLAAQKLLRKVRLVVSKEEEADLFTVWPPPLEVPPGTALATVSAALAGLLGEWCQCASCQQGGAALDAVVQEARDRGIEDAAQALFDAHQDSLWRYLDRQTLDDVLRRVRARKGDRRDMLTRRLDWLRHLAEEAGGARDRLSLEVRALKRQVRGLQAAERHLQEMEEHTKEEARQSELEATSRPEPLKVLSWDAPAVSIGARAAAQAPLLTNEERWRLAKLPGRVPSFRKALEMLPAGLKLLDTATGTIFTVAELLEESPEDESPEWLFQAHVHAGTSEYRLWLRCKPAGAVYMETTAGV